MDPDLTFNANLDPAPVLFIDYHLPRILFFLFEIKLECPSRWLHSERPSSSISLQQERHGPLKLKSHLDAILALLNLDQYS